MNPSPDKIQSALGIDVGRDSVTIHDTQTGRTLSVDNDTAALQAALHPLRRRDLAVCEATGGHEDKLLAVLGQLAIPAHRADAAKVRAFINSFGKRAKTDAIDAGWLARYGLDRAASLAHWRPPLPQLRHVQALVARRLDLVAMRASEKNRLKAPRSHAVGADIEAHIAELDRRIAAIEGDIRAVMDAHRDLAVRQAALRSVTGIGPVLAPMLIAVLPELGTLNRRQAASLAACAPHPRDSGKATPHRSVKGGRRHVRPALFVAALAAIRGHNPLAHAYRTLLAAGKPKRLALSAIMRRIVVIANARIRDACNAEKQLTW